jgi:hypothetical protein
VKTLESFTSATTPLDDSQVTLPFEALDILVDVLSQIREYHLPCLSQLEQPGHLHGLWKKFVVRRQEFVHIHD